MAAPFASMLQRGRSKGGKIARGRQSNPRSKSSGNDQAKAITASQNNRAKAGFIPTPAGSQFGGEKGVGGSGADLVGMKSPGGKAMGINKPKPGQGNELMNAPKK